MPTEPLHVAIANRRVVLFRSRSSQERISVYVGRNQLGLRRVAVTASVADRNEDNENGTVNERPCSGASCGEGRP